MGSEYVVVGGRVPMVPGGRVGEVRQDGSHGPLVVGEGEGEVTDPGEANAGRRPAGAHDAALAGGADHARAVWVTRPNDRRAWPKSERCWASASVGTHARYGRYSVMDSLYSQRRRSGSGRPTSPMSRHRSSDSYWM